MGVIINIVAIFIKTLASAMYCCLLTSVALVFFFMESKT